jgi:hypothetical protein
VSIASKFQKIHSDLIIETESKSFVSQEQKQRVDNSLLSNNNLSDLTDTAQAVENLGLSALLSAISEMSLVNERLPIIDGKFTLSKQPLSNKFIMDICMIVTPNNLILSEEYDSVVINGTEVEFKSFNEEYEGNECLVSYISTTQ